MSRAGRLSQIARWALLSGSGLCLLATALWLGQDQGNFASWVWVSIAAAVGASALIMGSLRLWQTSEPGLIWVLVILLAGVAFRLSLLPSTRYLSDDAYRYHWDGKVSLHGINPYQYPPSHPVLGSLPADDIDTRINHPDVRTVYPPLAQISFACAYWLTPGSLRGFQYLLLLSEILCWLLLWRELRRRKLPQANLLILVWSPLILFETYLPGHVDALALPWLTLFIIALGKKQCVRVGLFLALACLIKPLALIFVPAAAWHLGLKPALKTAATFLAICLLLYAPFLSAGFHLFSSMWLMGKFWSFNASLAAILEEILPRDLARAVALLTLAGLLLASVMRTRDLLSRLALAMGAFVVCTTTLFPWYLIWMFPILVLRPDPALLLLSALSPLTEIVSIGFRLDGSWDLPLWVRLTLYLPFFLLLAIAAKRRWGMFRG